VSEELVVAGARRRVAGVGGTDDAAGQVRRRALGAPGGGGGRVVDELVQASRPGNTATAPTVAAAFKTLRRVTPAIAASPLDYGR